MEYQSKYFEADLLRVDVNDIKKLIKKDNKLVITFFKKKENNID
jgi:hypothetical protein